jgi:hypothetical protein
MQRCVIAIFGALLPWLGAIACCRAADATQGAAASPTPTYRVETDGFEASEADIRAVLDSAARELWRFFPDYKIEPIVVTRGHGGPITLYQRNDRGEIVIRLDTGKTFWCQYAYQFAHEFCHVLCGFKEGYQGNKWFEETLCETASLFVMRAMSRTWKTSPPYPNWKDYRDSLRDYTDDVVRKRDKVYDVYRQGLPGFYRAQKTTLEKEPTSRELNGAMSIVFLQLFEEQPERWEAIRWLNATPPPKGETFEKYLHRWHDAVPKKHQPFVERVAELYGVAIKAGRKSTP